MNDPHSPAAVNPEVRRPNLFGAAPQVRPANPATEMRIDVLSALSPDAPKPRKANPGKRGTLLLLALSTVVVILLAALVWHSHVSKQSAEAAESQMASAQIAEPVSHASADATPANNADNSAPGAQTESTAASIETLNESLPASSPVALATQPTNPLAHLTESPGSPTAPMPKAATSTQPDSRPQVTTSGSPAPNAASQASAVQTPNSLTQARKTDTPAQQKPHGILSALSNAPAGGKQQGAQDTDVMLLEALISNPAAKATPHKSGSANNGPASAKPARQTDASATNNHAVAQTSAKADTHPSSGSTSRFPPEVQSAAQEMRAKAVEAGQDKATETATTKAGEASDKLLDKLKVSP